MSEQDLQFLESYLLKPKEDLISKLIKGSDQYYYFTLLKQLNDNGYKVPEDIKRMLEDYKLLKTEYARDIELRAKFLEFDQLNSEKPSPQVDQTKLKILRFINSQLFGYQFNHQEPPSVQVPSQINNYQLTQKKSTLTFSQIKYDHYLEQAYTEVGFKLILPQLYHLLDVKRIAEAPLIIQKQFIHNLGNEIVDFPHIPFLYNELFKNKKFNNEFNYSDFRKISLAQMEELLTLNKGFLENELFVVEYYHKKFQTNLNDVNYIQLEKEEIQTHKKKLREIYIWASYLPPKFQQFSHQILYKLLLVGNELNEYDLELFLTYLKDPKTLYAGANENQKNNKNNMRQFGITFLDYHYFNAARCEDNDQLVRTYLHKYFVTTDNYDIFLPYFEEKYLQREFAYVKLLSGQEQQHIYDFLGQQELEQLYKQKIITICSNNKLTFKKGEPVKLFVELKNIPTLNIKIFHLDTENYFLENKSPIDQDINLDGLVASEEINFQYTQPPILKFSIEFTFETITKADRGTFILEFIGNGVTSRAIIDKGRLLLKESITVAGHAFQILNEDFEVCTGPKTGLWLDNKFYVVDPVRQEILIPFGPIAKDYQAIIVHENYSELTNIYIQEESYSLNCAFIVANEQLLLGAKAKALIIPKLYINGNQASLKLLKDVLVTVTNINDANVPSTIFFDSLKLQDGQPVEIQFPITAKIRTITIKFYSKITRINQGNCADEILEAFHQITFQTYESTNLFCQQYLRYTEDGYQIFLLGKNGEPKAGLDINIQLLINNISTPYQETLTTDQDGKITLGHLENVNTINSSVIQVKDIMAEEQSWSITLRQQLTQYPNEIYVTVGQRVEIPVSLQDRNFSLIKMMKDGQQVVLASVKYLVKEEQNQLVVIPDDDATYQLRFKANGQTILINAIKGVQINKDIIVGGQTLIEDLGLQNAVILHSIKKQKLKEDKILIQGQITSNADTQIISVASQFDDPQNIQIILDQISSLLCKLTLNTISASLYTNINQNNKVLSDEYRYVLNRKHLERYVGNTLEKPQLLLKRQLIQDTEIQSEQLAQEAGYKYDKTQPQNNRQNARLADARRLRQYGHQKVSTFQDFLKNPALLINNIVIEGNQFQFQLPDQFSVVYIIAFNNNNQTVIQEGLTNKQIQKRNLAHESALERNKFYSIFRKTQLIKEGENLQIADITSTEIKLVDSIDKIFVFLKEARRLDGINVEYSSEFEKWEFLIKWHKLTIDEKNKLYDEYQSNELNIFIYFRDPAYFETYTKSYISNKIEKDFTDKFLLNDKLYMIQQASIENLDGLNTLEQVLLVIYFAEIAHLKDQATQIAHYLEQKSKLIQQDQKRYKALFDTVFSARTGEESFQPQSSVQVVAQPVIQQSGQFYNTAPVVYQQVQYVQAMGYQQIDQRKVFPSPHQTKNKKIKTYLDRLFDDGEECVQNEDEANRMEVQPKPAKEGNFYENARAQQQVEVYKKLENTKEYGERHYYQRQNIDDTMNLVSINKFWVDLAWHSVNVGILKENFISPNFIHCSGNHTEMTAVLALLGLPNNAPDNQFKQFQSKGVQIISQGTSILFTKEIKEGKAQLRNDILVAQRFFDPQDRFTFSDDDPELQLDKDVKECTIDKIYGCQVIITNCSSTRADYQVLVEVPNGAIPVNTVAYTKSYTIFLNPYSTEIIEYFFYFPKVGNFSIYPANISRLGIVISVAKEQHLNVVVQKTVADMEVLEDILVKGNKADILNFVATKNIFNPNIFRVNQIFHLLRDKDFYLKILDIFRKRKYFNHTVWTYALEHGDHESLKELFNSKQVTSVLKSKFAYFSCGLFDISNIKLNEFYPLVTKRVHKSTQEAKGILNQNLLKQYLEFLTYLTQKPKHQISDKLAFIYYLLIQERINEAIQVYQTITEPPKEGEAVMQYDYFTAYLDFYIGFPNFIQARKICEQYLNYPSIHWRNLFYEIVNQLTEFDGDDDQIQNQKDSIQLKKVQNSAQKEETLQINIERQKIIITYSNLKSISLQFYKVDLETLFSRNPFMNDNGNFSYILPTLCIEIPLGQKPIGLVLKHTIDIPEDLAQSNIFIQAKGVNKRSQVRYFPTSLNVQIMENNGQIKVSDKNGKYLSKIYVKTFIKEKNGKESFYKDGYTDLRGRFDYASLSSSELNNAEKFSILIMSDTLGSVIKEIQAPSQVGRFEQEVKLVSKAWATKACETFDRQTENYSKNQMRHQKAYK